MGFYQTDLNQVFAMGNLDQELMMSEVFQDSCSLKTGCKGEKLSSGERILPPKAASLAGRARGRASRRHKAGTARGASRRGGLGRLPSFVPEAQNPGGSCLGRGESERASPLTRAPAL